MSSSRLFQALYNVSGSWADATVLAKLEQIVDLSFYYLFDLPDTNRLIGGKMKSFNTNELYTILRIPRSTNC